MTTSGGIWGASYDPTFNGNGEGVYLASSVHEEKSFIYAHALLTLGYSQYHHANRGYPYQRPALFLLDTTISIVVECSYIEEQYIILLVSKSVFH